MILTAARIFQAAQRLVSAFRYLARLRGPVSKGNKEDTVLPEKIAYGTVTTRYDLTLETNYLKW